MKSLLHKDGVLAKNGKSVGVLVSICAVMALLLAGTNVLTADMIEKNQAAAANEALLRVMPEGAGFEPVDSGAYTLPKTVTKAYRESEGRGYVIELNTTGYNADFIIMCGVTTNGTVTGAVCLSSKETLNKEATYGEQFTGKDADGVAAVDTIAGATKTTTAYKEAVQDALNAAIILGGGAVDIRDEEEILADNLDAALPAGERAFTKMFITERLDGVDAVYRADNGAGYVFQMGEQWIGSDNAAVADALKTLKNSRLTEIKTAGKDIHKNITKVEKTATGHYVFTVKGAGYGITGGNEYHPASGEYILIRVAMTADGTILDCVTLSQAETKGLGDACADESFYGQFAGKTEQTYTAIDAISGATMTTNGYLTALQRCFEALSVLEGGARQ